MIRTSFTSFCFAMGFVALQTGNGIGAQPAQPLKGPPPKSQSGEPRPVARPPQKGGMTPSNPLTNHGGGHGRPIPLPVFGGGHPLPQPQHGTGNTMPIPHGAKPQGIVGNGHSRIPPKIPQGGLPAKINTAATGNLGKPGPFRPNPVLRFVLPQSVNTVLGQLSNGNKLDAATQSSLNHAMAGESLSPVDRLLLANQLGNNNLTPTEKAAISRALQEDLKEKLQIAQFGLGNGGSSIPTPMIVYPPSTTIFVPPTGGGGTTTGSDIVMTGGTTGTSSGGNLSGGSDIDTTQAVQYGLQIKQVGAGGAASTAGLKVGQVLVMVGGQRVQSFDEMTQVLSSAGEQTEVVYYDETGSLQTKFVQPKGGKLGVAVEPIVLQ